MRNVRLKLTFKVLPEILLKIMPKVAPKVIRKGNTPKLRLKSLLKLTSKVRRRIYHMFDKSYQSLHQGLCQRLGPCLDQG